MDSDFGFVLSSSNFGASFGAEKLQKKEKKLKYFGISLNYIIFNFLNTHPFS